ncbi:MAG: hypothetical protein ACOC9N_03140 [Gemmatimonadota bacterium]
MNRRFDIAVAAFAIGGAGLVACGPSGDRTTARETSDRCEAPEMVGELPSELIEASGVTRDPRHPDVFWAHNDSGNPAELFAVDREGELIAVVPLEEAPNRDFEDIAVGPCPAGSCLYLGDIGDNLAVHASVRIHRLPLPELPEPPEPPEGSDASDAGEPPTLPAVRPDTSWHLVYPAGPRDAESLAIDAERDELIIVTKGREDVVELYSLPLGELRGRPGSPDTLRRVGRLPLPIGAGTSQLITGGDLSPDASRLVVRSYTTLYEFAWPGAAEFDTLAAPAASSLLGALEAQGEGVAWDDSGETLFLVSEGRGGRPPSISRIRCPAP